jgi:hypothetical protein
VNKTDKKMNPDNQDVNKLKFESKLLVGQ